MPHDPSSPRDPYRDRNRDRNREQRRRKPGHRVTDSQGELLPRPREESESESPTERTQRHARDRRRSRGGDDGIRVVPVRRRADDDGVRLTPGRRRESGDDGIRVTPTRKRDFEEKERRDREERRERKSRGGETSSSATPLSLDSLARLNEINERTPKGWKAFDTREREVREEVRERERREVERGKVREDKERERRERRESKEGYRSSRERTRRSKIVDPDTHEIERRGFTDGENEKRRNKYTEDEREERKRRYIQEKERHKFEREEEERRRFIQEEKEEKRRRRHEERKRRVVSGPLLEEGGNEKEEKDEIWEQKFGFHRGGGKGSTTSSEESFLRRRKKTIWIGVTITVIILIIAIPVGIVVSKKGGSSADDEVNNTDSPNNDNLNNISESDIPASAKGGLLDPFTWYDTTDFNLTYTDETIGGLSLMGLNSTWNDDVRANPNVPKIKDEFKYGAMPIRGMNVGGWLNLEPFITPSFFADYNSRDVIDEWTLTKKLGPTKAAQKLEKHYSTFITKKTFADIRAAGFDHVRIPFNYWAITTYPGDPYVPKISWRYLLRGIEYARQNGLRVNLDVHGLPGSQNGWNHSGRQGVIGWLNGTDGDLNAQRSLDIHDQLSTFFAQPRYKKLVTMYGLVNEPRMVDLNTESVLNWYDKAINLVRNNGITAVIVFGDGFMGLDKWQGKLQDHQNLLLDVHQYVIFNVDQIALEHDEKLTFACKGWTAQTLRSQNTATGFGPTMCGEWSQADTDCAPNLNNVGRGNRWEGTLNTGNKSTSVLSPTCPTKNDPKCDCGPANADPADYSDAYKKWLLYFAQGQMESFEKGWGWFYWTWETEKAVHWSYRRGLEAGILPKLAYERSFKCSDDWGDFGEMGLPEEY